MTIYDGWDELKTAKSQGTYPDSENSLTIYAVTRREKQYGGCDPYLLISQVITKENLEDFSEDELFPIQKIEYEDQNQVGAYGTTTLYLKDGSVKKICFEGLEACF